MLSGSGHRATEVTIVQYRASLRCCAMPDAPDQSAAPARARRVGCTPARKLQSGTVSRNHKTRRNSTRCAQLSFDLSRLVVDLISEPTTCAVLSKSVRSSLTEYFHQFVTASASATSRNLQQPGGVGTERYCSVRITFTCITMQPEQADASRSVESTVTGLGAHSARHPSPLIV